MVRYGVVAILAILALSASTAQSQSESESTGHLQSNAALAASNRETLEIVALNKRVGELHQAGKDAEAIPFAKTSLELSEKALGPAHPTVATLLNQLAELNRITGQYVQAESLYQRALGIRERALGPTHPDVAQSLNNLAVLYLATGQYVQAEPLYQRALAINEKALGPVHPEVATNLNNLAELYKDTGQYAQAELLHQRALVIREEALGSMHLHVAQSLNNLAVLYHTTGRYAQAEPLYQRALTIRKQVLGSAHPDVAQSLNNLAELYRDTGQFAQAEPLYQRALAINTKALSPAHPGVAASFNSLAVLYHTTGRSAQAEPLYQRALGIREQVLGPTHPDVAQSLNNLAMLYKDTGQFAQAEPLLQRALAIDEKALGSVHPGVATDLNNLATLYDVTGQYVQAESLYQRALAINEKALGPQHPRIAIGFNNLARLAATQQRYRSAVGFFQQGLRIQDHYIRDVFAFTTEAQKLRFIQSISGAYEGYLSLIHQHLSQDPAIVRDGLDLVLRRKGVVLDAMARSQAAGQGRMSESTRVEWEELLRLRSEFAKLVLYKPETLSLDAYRARLTTLQRQIEETERRVASKSALVAAELMQRTVTAAAVAKALPKTAALVEFVKIRDYDFAGHAFLPVSRYLAFVLTATDEVTLVDLGEAGALEKQIGQVLEDLRVAQLYGHRPAMIKSLVSLKGLSSTLWAPLTAALGQTDKVLLSPDGLLSLVPLAALPDGEGRFLLERYRLAYVTSGRELVGMADARRQPAMDLLLVANPAYDTMLVGASDLGGALRSRDYRGHFLPLPGTQREAEEIPPLVFGSDTQKQVVTGGRATEGVVKRSRSPRVLHLATHGFFLDDQELSLESPTLGMKLAGDPMATSSTSAPLSMRYENPMVRAGLALAGANHAADSTTGDDGILTALEITGMDLQETELVVLSACETAVGTVQTGEGVFGLRRAFALAGAKNLLMSLWLVDDQVTADQMKAFYQNLRTMPPADALRQAQLETIRRLKERDGVANPGLWAPFILQGTNTFGSVHSIADSK